MALFKSIEQWHIRKQKKRWILKIKKNPYNLYKVPDRLKTIGMCYMAVKANGYVIHHGVPERFRTEKMWSIAAYNDDRVFFYDFFPNQFKTTDMCLSKVKKNRYIVDYVPDNLLTTEFCLMAIKENPAVIEFIPDHLKTNELCLAMVKINRYYIKYVPKNLITMEIFFEAFDSILDANQFFMYEHKDFPWELATSELHFWIVHNPDYFPCVPYKLKTTEMCLKVLILFRDDRWQFRRTLKSYSIESYLKLIPDNLKTREICLVAVELDEKALHEFVPDRFKTEEICIVAIQYSMGKALEFVPEHLKTEEIYLVAIQYSMGKALEFVPEDIINEKMCLIALEKSEYNFAYVPENLKSIDTIKQKYESKKREREQKEEAERRREEAERSRRVTSEENTESSQPPSFDEWIRSGEGQEWALYVNKL